jgi:RecB family exonuclease
VTTDRRRFLGWDRLPLPLAAERLLGEHGRDLGGLTVAVPGLRAARRLREHLARRAGPGWTPPEIVTHGVLSDRLVRLERPSAGRLARTLAWTGALRGVPTERLTSLVSLPPEADDLGAWTRLAERLRALHAELAVEGLEFRALLPHVQSVSVGEAERWEVLAEAQDAYRAALGAHGLLDPHEGRRAALAAGAVARDARVALVGVVDMNGLLRDALAEVTDVVAYVFAPESAADAFDEWGCLALDAWSEREIPALEDRWRVVDKPAEQARRALVDVAATGRPVEEVTIGVADEEVTPYLERRFARAGVAARAAAGLPLARTAPMRLLAAAARYLARRGWPELTALVRHPDLEPGLRAGARLTEDPASVVDQYHLEHLPARAEVPWPGTGAKAVRMRLLHDALREHLGALARARRPRPLAEWCEPVRAFLLACYGGRDLDQELEADRQTATALREVCGVLAELEDLPPGLLPACSASEALEIVLRQLASASVAPAPPRAEEPSVELLGWLELPLDDAPALVVTGLNEGRVPESVHADPFLPDSLRARLGLVDNRARLARDLYAATLLCESRDVTFVTGRRNKDGDPLAPSRLLFQCTPSETLQRVRRFLAPEPPRPTRANGGARPPGLARLAETPAVETMSVSSFRRYLESPYLFYLDRALKTRTLDDRTRELDPLRFGSLAHDVLELFGRSAVKDARRAEDIQAFLDATLEEVARARFGAAPLPAVALQLAQLRRRLSAFAGWQAAHAEAGWRIEHVEWEPPDGAIDFVVDGAPMPVRGRVDRIDRHATLGWALLDYKTGEKVKDPDKAHRKDGRWVDLQLPLYRHLVASLALEGPVALGYVALDGAVGSIGERMAHWGPDDLAEADEVARDVVRRVRRGEFFERGTREPYEPLYRALLGVGLLEAAEVEDPR